MFTGIITDVGTVEALEQRGDLRAVVKTRYDTQGISDGASIACSGACLTVVDKGADWFAVDISKETLDHTTLGAWSVGSRINLERSLRMGDELGGHMVSGHVDGVATVLSLLDEGDSRRLSIRVPGAISRFIASKGSVALDGISLTVNEVEADVFGVNIIPHTWEKTTLADAGPGSRLNVEIDMLARYVARLTERVEATRDGDA
ncbi:MAG: riboflavin synthase [Proteobacteria bacterium]|nr:riboflavin synthase [Pseudomonadota bacterium]